MRSWAHSRGAARAHAAVLYCALVVLAATTALLAPRGALAEVTGDAQGFVVKHEAVVALPPAQAYALALRVQEWRDPAHTYSGDAANLSLRAEPGGCWCEKLGEGAFVEHMRVVLAWPGRTLRLQGGFGPLQQMGAAGAALASR